MFIHSGRNLIVIFDLNLSSWNLPEMLINQVLLEQELIATFNCSHC